MAWVATGVTGASLVTGIAGGIFGSKSAKKRQNELEAKIRDITNRVAESTKERLRNVDKLTEEQIVFADEQLKDVLAYYGDMKLKYQALYERNSAEAERQYGAQLKEIEGNLQEELGIQTEVFQEYQSNIDALYGDVRDLYQADLAFNDTLGEEFRTSADQAIKDTWEASAEAKIDLQQLKDSGGRPESFDRVVAENAKAFGDIQTDIDRSDAARGRTDLTGKKLTTQFAEAMSKGNIAGQMAEAGQRQEQSLRGEVVGLGNTAMEQQKAKLMGGAKDSGIQMANLQTKFEGQKIDSIMKQGMGKLNMTADANQKNMIATDLYNQTMTELQTMLDQGQISADEAVFVQQGLNEQLKQQAKEQNWQYKDQTRQAQESQMLQTAGMAGQELSQINPSINWAQIGGNAIGAFASTYRPTPAAAKTPTPVAGGPSANPNTNYGQEPATNQSFWGKLFGTSGSNVSKPAGNSPYLGRFGTGS